MKLHIAYIVLIVALAAGGSLAVHYAIGHAREDAKNQVLSALAEKERQRLQQENVTLQEQVAVIRADAAAKIHELEQQRLHITTIAQAAPVIKAETPLKSATIATTPDAPSVISQQEAISLAQFGLSCRECTTARDALKAENDKVTQQLTNSTESEKLLKGQLDRARKQAKSGSIWYRTFKAVELMACGGIGAALGSQAPGEDRRSHARNAAIGGASGVLLCSFLGK